MTSQQMYATALFLFGSFDMRRTEVLRKNFFVVSHYLNHRSAIFLRPKSHFDSVSTTKRTARAAIKIPDVGAFQKKVHCRQLVAKNGNEPGFNTRSAASTKGKTVAVEEQKSHMRLRNCRLPT